MASPFAQPAAGPGAGFGSFGSSALNGTNPKASPFAPASAPSAQQLQKPSVAANPFDQKPSTMTNGSPFSSPPTAPAASNTFGAPSLTTGAAGRKSRSKSPFSQQPIANPSTSSSPSSPFGKLSGSTSSPFGQPAPAPFANGTSQKGAPPQKGMPPPQKQNGFGAPSGLKGQQPNGPRSLSKPAASQKRGPNPGAPTGPSKTNGVGQGSGQAKRVSFAPQKAGSSTVQVMHDNSSQSQSRQQPQPQPRQPKGDYARAIYAQLKKDGVKRPKWPANPGDPSQRNAMTKFWESYKAYREQARKSLVRANLIDDPDKQKTLAEAIDFKGICEEMCPEFEKINRIIQNDVKQAEKTDGITNPDKMMKALARSAAGQEAPLPMDVLSIPACRRTVDYLLDDVLRTDSNLSAMHGFLWDRTRAVRRDFVFHSSTTDAEKLDQIYCLETIVRFHAVALHLMSQKGFAGDDFSEKQEIEQLSKGLLSLQDMYKRCRKSRRVTPPNEAEFVAYSILLYARDPSALSRVYQWGKDMYDTSKDVRTAIAIVESIQNTWDLQGPEIGRPSDSMTPFTTALPNYSMIFSILDDPEVSYTMGCFAEILFPWVRQSILKTIHSSFWRPKTVVRDFTIERLTKMLRFDAEEETIEFLEQNGIDMNTTENGEMFMVLVQKGNIEMPKIPQCFSHNLVEHKREDRPITQVLREQVYSGVSSSPIEDDEDSLFVSDKQPQMVQPQQQQPPPSPKPRARTLPAQQNSTPIPQASPFSANLQPAAPQPATTSPFLPQPQFPPVQSTTQPPPLSVLNQPSPFSTSDSSGTQSPFQPPKGPINLQTMTAQPSPVPTLAPELPKAPAQSLFSSLTPPSLPTEPKQTPAESTSTQTPPAIQLLPPTPTSILQNGTPTPSPFPSFATPAAPSTHPANSQASPVFKPSGNTSSVLFPSPQTVPAQPSFLPQAPSAPAPAASLAPAKPPAPPPTTKPSSAMTEFIPFGQKQPEVDKMQSFTKWVVIGDGGLLEQFIEVEVERLVQEAYDKFHAELEAAKRKEELAHNEAIARQFRVEKVAQRFGRMWHGIAYMRASKRRGKENRARYRAWCEGKIERDRVVREKRELEVRQVRERELYGAGERLEGLRTVVSLQQRGMKERAMADALLGTGLLAGVRDVKGCAKKVASEDEWVDCRLESEVRSGRASPKRHKIAAVGGLEQSLMLPPGPPRSDDTVSVASGISSVLSMSAKAKGKTAKVLEALRTDMPESLGKNFRRSLPPMTALGNRRSLSSSTLAGRDTGNLGLRKLGKRHERERARLRQSAVPDAYWRFKQYGNVAMPNGQLLPEKLAEGIRGGKEWSGLYAADGEGRGRESTVGSGTEGGVKRGRCTADVGHRLLLQHEQQQQEGSHEHEDDSTTSAPAVKKHRQAASTDVADDEARRLRMERLRENDPETWELIMSTRQTSALMDDATEVLREINTAGGVAYHSKGMFSPAP